MAEVCSEVAGFQSSLESILLFTNAYVPIGGAQNVAKKNSDKDGGKEKKDKTTKIGGFRGLRGIV
jgi:hypothetical protein